MTAEVVNLAEVRALKAASFLVRRAELTYNLLSGPITPRMVDALEHLNEADLEAFFRARARHQLQEAQNQ